MREKPRVLIIGESCYDLFVYGEVNRLSPERPVPVLNPVRTVESMGMAGNVYENFIKSEAVEPFLVTCSRRIKKTRYVHEGTNHQFIRIDENDKCEPVDEAKTFLAKYSKSLSDFDAVVFSDYDKGFLGYRFIAEVSRMAKQLNIPVFIDTKKKFCPVNREYWFEDISFIKINTKEYAAQDRVFCEFCKDAKINLIVTQGGEGALWVNKAKIVPTEKVPVYSLDGAGDTFLAWLVVGYFKYVTTDGVYGGDKEFCLEERNKGIEKAIQLANTAAAVKVTHPGVYAPTKKEVEDAIKS